MKISQIDSKHHSDMEKKKIPETRDCTSLPQ